MSKTINWVKLMKFSYLASAVLAISVSAPQLVSANALTADETKKVPLSDAIKFALSVINPSVDPKTVHDPSKLKSTQALIDIQKQLSSVRGGLTGGTRTLE